jgi:hypothetical protein
MKMLIKSIEDQGIKKNGKKILTFKEFCQYVYEPSERIKSLGLPKKEKYDLISVIEARKLLE